MVKKKTISAFTVDSKLQCPDCEQTVHVGTGGEKNLESHRTSKACKAKKQPPNLGTSIRNFFGKKLPATISSTVTAPPPVHAPIVSPLVQQTTDGQVVETALQSDSVCAIAVRLLEDILSKIMTMPEEEATKLTMDHPLHVFDGDPALSVAPGQDDWEDMLNPMIHAAFGYGIIKHRRIIQEMLMHGPCRGALHQLHDFLMYFVTYRGLKGALFEVVGTVIVEEIGSRFRQDDDMAERTAETLEVIDVDEFEDLVSAEVIEATTKRSPKKTTPCIGLRVRFPAGKNQHTSYPFGLHSKLDVPWNYHSINDSFFLQAKSCKGFRGENDVPCTTCHALTSTTLYEGIIHRIENGVHENTPLIYHGVGGLLVVVKKKGNQVDQLRMTKLNNSKKLLGKATALEDHKQWIMAVASGKVDRVAALVQAGLKHHAGVRGLIREYERAAQKLYTPKGYTEEDLMRSVVMLRLGGTRVAEFAHRSMSLPSLTTIRRNTVIRPLIVSPSKPVIAEIEANIISCYEAIGEVMANARPRVIHQILMLDELATEKRARWDDSNDKFQGTCREHNHRISLIFSSERELELLCDALDAGEVHLSSEASFSQALHNILKLMHDVQATVAALGILSENPREYSARPIMISGTCKKETGAEHACLLQTLLKATENQQDRNGVRYRTVSIASDGEAKRGDALVLVTMRFELDPDSPIFKYLNMLQFMNFLVGPDDITADKDFKHIFKRLRNLLMRNKGFVICGFCVTSAILRAHLQANGVVSWCLRSLLNPNNKQDVVLGYSLLKEIWSLPPAPEGSSPSFVLARNALRAFGQFAYHLVNPYICIDLDLDEQLSSLSTAAHLALYLFTNNSSRTKFMPSQSYVDIMIMVKNVYFTVAKAKVDNPDGKSFIIIFGTDRLELHFGLVRCSTGTDSNVDSVQLGNRSSGLVEVATILALHPEWDQIPRRLNLPAISKDADVDAKLDHLTPPNWKGDTHHARVNLHTCWILGRRKAIELIPEAGPALELLSQKPGIDILAPFGELLVNQRDPEGEFDCSDLAAMYADAEHRDLVEPSMSGSPFTHEGDMEDAIAEEVPRNLVSSSVFVKGQMTTKAKALRHRMMSQKGRASTDRLKRVQQIPCFNPTSSDSNIVTSHDSPLGAPCLRIGNPIATLVRCEGRHLDELGLHHLADDTAKVDFQILRLIPATVEDDPTQEHDWCWSLQMEAVCENIPGRLVHPVNPAISMRTPGKPTYLFESSFLVTLSASLHQELLPQDLRSAPNVKQTEHYPYRWEGKACFVYTPENTLSSSDTGATDDLDCGICGPKCRLDRSSAQRVLEHVGAHILYDQTLDKSQELCGLCLRPSPMCLMYLKKGRGAAAGFNADPERSTCLKFIKFNCATAARSSATSPCSNVPLACPLCPANSPAVWRYNLSTHFRQHHKLAPTHFPTSTQLSQSEKDGMKQKWDARFTARKTRNLKKHQGKNALLLSAAHSSHSALRTITEDDEEPMTEDDSDMEISEPDKLTDSEDEGGAGGSVFGNSGNGSDDDNDWWHLKTLGSPLTTEATSEPPLPMTPGSSPERTPMPLPHDNLLELTPPLSPLHISSIPNGITSHGLSTSCFFNKTFDIDLQHSACHVSFSTRSMHRSTPSPIKQYLSLPITAAFGAAFSLSITTSWTQYNPGPGNGPPSSTRR
ncbi:hypothetical protein Hypma_014567 [Hypsizygus marmoreus]|uniref:Uncharacterized protein n=1 Tax=Hypsizygus marmoreus TaxID=39966 RepID=A0A369JDZ2_HYPMA|nr:hypothetical protein Hypma_014567 [Hypsizygus marmoreus]